MAHRAPPARGARALDVTITPVGADQPELVDIRCRKVTDEVREIANFVRMRQGKLYGRGDQGQTEVAVVDVLYIESVDERTLIYTAEGVFQTGGPLYELEERLKRKRFLRVSKSTIVNLMKVRAIKPALNGRFLAVMSNGEQVMISRKYAPELKRVLREGSLC